MIDDRVKFQMRISPDTDRKIKAAMPLSNCRIQNKSVEKALRFYCKYGEPRGTVAGALRTLRTGSEEDPRCGNAG